MIYCFRDVKTDEPFELCMTMKEYEASKLRPNDPNCFEIRYEGRCLKRDFADERPNSRVKEYSINSNALAIHPDQVEEFREERNHIGLTASEIDWGPNGDCHVKSRRGRKLYMKYKGFHDKNGGYGD